jgi:hypothetical protein
MIGYGNIVFKNILYDLKFLFKKVLKRELIKKYNQKSFNLTWG